MSTIIIFGLSTPGLFLLREFAINGYNVIGIGRKDDFGRFSKYGIKYTAENESDLKVVIEKITSACTEKPKGIIASAYYLALIVNKFPELFNMINIDGPGFELLKTLDNKISSYDLLKSFGIPVLKTYEISEFESISENEFPIILKWNSTELDLHKRIINKTKIVENKIQLLCILRENAIQDTMIISQKYLSGEHIEEYGYGGYYKDGKVKAEIFVNGLRQFPRGIYSFAREVEENNITNKIRNQLGNMLKKLNYTGFIHFDILVDCNSGEYYVLDVNPRPWNSIAILKKKYINFIDIFSFYDIELTKNINIIQWIDVIKDFLCIIQRSMRSRNILLILKDYSEYFKYSTIFNMYQYNSIKLAAGWLWIYIKKLCKSVLSYFNNI